jgi:hypothetical protein
MPPLPIERGAVGPGLLAHIIVSKYADHQPLYRQESILERHGLHIPRSVTCEWVMKSAELLEPLTAAMRAELLRGAVINTDDTPVDVHTREGNHQARLWTYVGDPLHPYTVYDFTWDRSGEGPRKFLKGFAGTLQADAFSGYDRLFRDGGIVEAGCLAHARRKFYEARQEDPLIALPILALVRQLYAVERTAREQWPALLEARPDPEELARAQAARLELRQGKSAPRMAELEQTLRELQGTLLPKSGLGQAVGYALNHWSALGRLLEDGAVAIDNNAAERALRPLALGRKNWLQLGSRRGGRAAAVLFSLVRAPGATGSIRSPICATCSRASRRIRTAVSTSSSRITGCACARKRRSRKPLAPTCLKHPCPDAQNSKNRLRVSPENPSRARRPSTDAYKLSKRAQPKWSPTSPSASSTRRTI